MKKRVLTILLTCALSIGLLAGCGEELESPIIATVVPEPIVSEEVVGSTENVTSGDVSASEEATENTEESKESEEESKAEENIDPTVMYRSELTNEWISKDIESQRPVAIMVDNESTALPHYGLTEADVVYEIMNSTANNRITRFMAVVKDWESITQFGSIRSTRPTNIMLAAEWNAVLVHDGGPFYIDDWLARKYAANLSGGFARIENGKPREFTEYVTTGELASRIKAKGYSRDYNDYYPGQHFMFSDDTVDLSTLSYSVGCKEIKLPFPHNRSTLTYNEKTKTYDYSEYGAKHLDPLHDNAQLTFKNVIIQNTTFSQLDSNGYLIYNAIDSGRNGLYITNGQVIDIVWTKDSETAVTKYYNGTTGKEIEINTGKTYIALVPSDSWSDIEIKYN